MDSANAASAGSPTKNSSLGLRIASVIVLLPILVVGVYLGLWVVVLIAALAVVLAVIELFAMFRHGGYQPRTAVGIVGGLAFCIAATFQGALPADLTMIAAGFTLMLGLVYEIGSRDRSQSLLNWALTVGGAMYVGVLISYFILIRRLDMPISGGWLAFLHIPAGAAWIYTIFAITWLQDTAAYFVGRSFGKRKFAPILSPKKTWEGAIGGFVTSIAVALLALPMLGLPMTWWQAVLLGVVNGVAGPLGDLAESLIKRQVGMKDSGNLIPGHGGILDRADSLMFTAAVSYYVILLTVPIG